VLAAAEDAHISIAWLPFRSPELNPLEDLWRLLTVVVAANRVYDTLDIRARHAIAWLDAHLPDALLTCGGPHSSKFEWLLTYATCLAAPASNS
jgi:transposase